ncbi:MAG: CARDB domain-containing protein [Chloroflexota bacterium]|nr:CARDB domain-containing protein [Chloroflexota bacterium]
MYVRWLALTAAATILAALVLGSLPSPAEAADPEPIEAALANIRGNFSQVWGFDNPTLQWKGYDPSAAPSANTLASLQQGHPYVISGVKQRVDTLLGSASITLYPGDNYVVWGVAPQLAASVPIGQALKPALSGKFSSVWFWDASTQAWYGYDPAQPLPQHTLQWLVPGYAYWFMGVATQTVLETGAARITLFPGSNLVAWPASAGYSSVIAPVQALSLPNFAPYTPSSWETPLALSTDQNATSSSLLSTTSPTWLRFAVANNGSADAPKAVRATILFDGRPMTSVYREGPTWTIEPGKLPSKQYTWGFIGQSLGSWGKISPGKHTVSLVIDPDNEIPELDETDNRYEQEFTWVATPVAAPSPALSPPRELPVKPIPEPMPGTPPPPLANLHPHQPSGWGAPFVFSAAKEDFAGTKPVPLSGEVYFALAVDNAGGADTSGPFDVEVWLDGKRLVTLGGGGALTLDRYRYWDGNDFKAYYRRNIEPGGALADGAHVLRVVIDPTNSIPERRETDNAYEYAFTVTNGVIPPVSTPRPPVVSAPPTAAQVREKLKKIGPLLQVVAPTVSEDEKTTYIPQIMEVFEAGYYLLTGRTVKQEQEEYSLTIAIDTRAQWVRAFDKRWSIQVERVLPQDYASRFRDFYKILNRAMGYFQPPGTGELPEIHSRGDATPRSVLQTLFHEIGHFRQWAIQRDSPGSNSPLSQKAMSEVQAQAFEAAGVRLLEELTGYNLGAFEEVESWRSVDANFERILSQQQTDEHDRGYLAAWGAVLNDPALDSLGFMRWKLTTFGYLDSRSSLDLFTYMVAIPWQQWAQRTDTYLSNLPATAATAKGLVRKRLLYNLPPPQRPSFDFATVAFSLP